MWDLKCKVKVEGILLGERMYRLYNYVRMYRGVFGKIWNVEFNE